MLSTRVLKSGRGKAVDMVLTVGNTDMYYRVPFYLYRDEVLKKLTKASDRYEKEDLVEALIKRHGIKHYRWERFN